MNKERKTYIIGGVSIQFVSDVYDGQLFDTEVNIKGVYFCTIAGQDIAEFKKQFENILKLRI